MICSLVRTSKVSAKCVSVLIRRRALRDFSTTVDETSTKPIQKDVVIVGCGPAGLSLATSLKSSPITSHLDIALIDGQDLTRLRNWRENKNSDSYENRVSSLTPRSVRHLKKIGAWKHILTERVQFYDEMKAWDGISGSVVEFDPFSLGDNDSIAAMVENSNIQQALLSRLEELGQGNAVMDGCKVSQITASSDPMSNWPVISLSNKTAYSAKLLVGADGQQSPVRKYADIETRGWAYSRSGLVASLKLEYDNYRTVAYQRFLPTGPIALLPMPNAHATLVWSTTPERAVWLKNLEPDVFCKVVDAGFRLEWTDLNYIQELDPKESTKIMDEIQWRLEETQLVDEDNTLPVYIGSVDENTRAAFPLKLSHADSYVGDRVALIGDAAHATHPLAGQGLNMGQRDAEFLIDALESAVRSGLDIGSSLALDPFWKNAYLQNHVKLGVVDKLHKLYGTDFWPVVKARSLGLDIVNGSDLIKKFLMQQASD